MPQCLAALRSLGLGAATSTLHLPRCPLMRGHPEGCQKAFGCAWLPWGTSSWSPVGYDVPRAGLGQGKRASPSSCTQGHQVGAGHSYWKRANSIFVPIRTCPALTQGHALGPPAAALIPVLQMLFTASSPLLPALAGAVPSPTSQWQQGDPPAGAATCPGAGM